MPLTINQLKKRREIIANIKSNFKWAGLYGGTGRAEKFGGVHAVTQADKNGARRSACGLIARFIPNATEWDLFENATLKCSDCKELI